MHNWWVHVSSIFTTSHFHLSSLLCSSVRFALTFILCLSVCLCLSFAIYVFFSLSSSLYLSFCVSLSPFVSLFFTLCLSFSPLSFPLSLSPSHPAFLSGKPSRDMQEQLIGIYGLHHVLAKVEEEEEEVCVCVCLRRLTWQCRQSCIHVLLSLSLPFIFFLYVVLLFIS